MLFNEFMVVYVPEIATHLNKELWLQHRRLNGLKSAKQ